MVDLVPDGVMMQRFQVTGYQCCLTGTSRSGDPNDRVLAGIIKQSENPFAFENRRKSGRANFVNRFDRCAHCVLIGGSFISHGKPQGHKLNQSQQAEEQIENYFIK
jgi:hypothetical protein